MDRKLFGVAGVAAKRLIGKVAVVTASTEGIGFAIAERLGQEGAKVAVSSRSQQNVDRAVNDLQKAGLEVTGIKCHVANATDRQALFSHAPAKIGAYAVSKTAILGLTKAVSLELASENIRVNCIAPGIVDTRFAGILSNTEENKARTLSLIPMGRIAQPKEISGVCAFLVSDDASYITGETIVASGGILSRL
uniref:Ketoreductase (KR) domain-containing protein n=1 Tax=Anopheles albimanus TaxID=7167 RepID=A0A182FF52_ANOAL